MTTAKRNLLSDTITLLGDTIADMLENPDQQMQGFDVAVAIVAFFDLLEEVATGSGKADIVAVRDDEHLRTVYLAKALPRCRRMARLLQALSPERHSAASDNAGVVCDGLAAAA